MVTQAVETGRFVWWCFRHGNSDLFTLLYTNSQGGDLNVACPTYSSDSSTVTFQAIALGHSSILVICIFL